MEIKIGNRVISETSAPYFIADIAANHDGDMDRAFRLIELAKEAGADAAKFQNFKAETIVSKNGFESLGTQLSHQASWKKSVFETYRDASLPDAWSEKLKRKCDEVGIEYMTSPYDFASVDLADRYVNAFKIGSGDITWPEILEHISKKGKPVLLATGASDSEDVKRAMQAIRKYNGQIVLMQCNTNYTADASNFSHINLNVLRTYRELYPDCMLGLSDHTFGHTTVLGAFALGARVFEKHFTDDNDREGPDHKFSMNPVTWKQMVHACGELREALGDGIKRVEKNELDTVHIQRRACYLTGDFKKGHRIEDGDLFPLRPVKEGAVLPFEKQDVIGKKLARDVQRDACLRWEDIEC
ncbi:N-acetylneuraminate synthase family protein [Lachnospiraceae bacterium 47-T17]